MSAPRSVVVDCSTLGAPAPEVAERFQEAAFHALQTGDLEKAAQLVEEAKETLARSQVASVKLVDLDQDALALRDADAVAELERVKTARRSEVEQALAQTDKWAARAVEDAVAMPAARIRYRQQLRGLFADIDAAAEVASVEAVKIAKLPASP